MIKKADILAMVRAVQRFDKGLPPRRLIYPAREWGIGVMLFVLSIIVVCLAAAYIYLTLDALERDVPPPDVSTITYQEATMERALELFADRSQRFEAVMATQPVAPVLAEAASTASTTQSSDEVVDEIVEPVEATTGELEVF